LNPKIMRFHRPSARSEFPKSVERILTLHGLVLLVVK
jgi:hypothetical protein